MSGQTGEASSLEGLLRAVLQVSQETEESAVERVAVEACARHLGFDRCGLWVFDAGRRELRTRWGVEHRLVQYHEATHPAPTKGLLRELLEGRRDRILVDDYDSRWADRLHPLMLGVRHYAAAALRAPREVFGYLSVDNLYTQRAIQPDQVDRLVLYAEHVGNALRLARELDEHRQTADALRERERLLRTVVNNAPIILFSLDPDGVVTFSDGRGLEAVGRRPGEAVGRSAFELYGRIPDLIEGLKLALAGEEVRQVVRVRPDLVWEGRLSPVFGEAGGLEGVIGVSTEITDLVTAREAAEAADQAKGRFLAHISHEVQTPLNGILAMCGLAAETDLTPEQQRWLRVIEASAEWLSRLLAEILEYATGADRVAEPHEFSLRELLDETLQALAAPAHQKGLELAYRVDPTVADLRFGEPLHLRQIIANLVGNAIKYTAAGEVIVSLRGEPGDADGLVMAVRDTGIGVADADRARIFEPFEQGVGDGLRRAGGSGLGLSIALQLAQALGGTVDLDSVPGGGSTFTLRCRLPRAGQDAREPVSPALLGRHALVVEDHLLTATYLAEQLAALGLRASLASDLEDALAQDLLAPPDIALLDAGLLAPDRLREALGQPGLPVILLLPAGRVEENGGVAQGRLTKPVGQRALAAALRQALAPSEPPAPLQVAARPLRVLIIEDNDASREMVEIVLRRQGHHPVAVGCAALALPLAAEAFDLVLLDLRLPDGDGHEVAADLRSGGLSAPIVAMSAFPAEDQSTGPQFAGWLAKPFRPRELLAAVERFADQPPGPR